MPGIGMRRLCMTRSAACLQYDSFPINNGPARQNDGTAQQNLWLSFLAGLATAQANPSLGAAQHQRPECQLQEGRPGLVECLWQSILRSLCGQGMALEASVLPTVISRCSSAVCDKTCMLGCRAS